MVIGIMRAGARVEEVGVQITSHTKGFEDGLAQLNGVMSVAEVGEGVNVGGGIEGCGEGELIVARSPGQNIAARLAVKEVVRSVAGQRIGRCVAGQVELGHARRAGIEIFQVFCQRQRALRGTATQLQGVDAATRCFGDDVLQGGDGSAPRESSLEINDVGIVACSTHQGVCASAPIQRVVARIAGDDVVKLVARMRRWRNGLFATGCIPFSYPTRMLDV